MKTFARRLLSALIFFQLLVSVSFPETTAALAPKRKLKMAYTDFAPFLEQTTEGPKGILIDQARKIVQRAGYDLELVYVPFKRMPSQLSNGDVDIWIGLTHYPEFKGKTFVGSKVILNLELMTYAFGKDIEIKKLEDLKKYRVLTFGGYSYGGLIEQIRDPANKYNWLEVKDNDQAYRLLSNNRADVFLTYKANMEIWQKNRPALRMRGHSFKTFPVHIAVSRKALDGADILKNLEQAVPTEVADQP